MKSTARRFLTKLAPLFLLGLAGLSTAGRGLGIWSSQVERLSHFRLWWIGLLLGLLLLFLKQKRPWPAGLSAVLMLVASVPLMGYAIPRQKAPATHAKPIKFIGWNLLWENQRHAEALTWLKEQDADVILLTECTKTWNKELSELATLYPHAISSDRDGAQGMWLLSRFPLDAPNPDGLSSGEMYPWISTVAHTPDGPVRIVGLHPRLPRSGFRFDQRNVQYDRAATIASSAAMPVVVLGDFNCTPFSPWFDRLLERGHLCDSALGYGIHSTWNSNGIGLPIDHILISSEWEVVDRRVHKDRMGSDHHPVTAVLVTRAKSPAEH